MSPLLPPLGNVLLSSCFSSLRLLPQIQVGKFNYTIAMLHLGGGETAIIVSIVICSILLVLSVVGKGKNDVFPGCAKVFLIAWEV